MLPDGLRTFLRSRHGVWQIRDRPLVVGRAPSCDIVLHDPSVSREHCVVLHDGASVVVCDLRSRNGLLVNGVAPGGTSAIHHGDRLTVGAEPLTVIVGRRLPKQPARRGLELSGSGATSTSAARAHELLMACVHNAIADGDLVGAELLGRSTFATLRRVVGASSDRARLLGEAAHLSASLAELTGDERWLAAGAELFLQAGLAVPPPLRKP